MSLVVTSAAGLVTVQDCGRPGHMHEGLPHGGALVRALLVEANRRARNPDDAAAIEVLGRLVVRANARVETSHGVIEAGEEVVVASEPRRVAYLAVRGGVDAPLVLGSRSTHLSAGLGAPLRAGAVIASLGVAAVEMPATPFEDGGAIRIVAGPDDGDVEALVSATYRISPSSDRVGTRLVGPALRAMAGEGSRPMVRGAIEVPRDGQPIVLGPEHPTTGGYPVIAVIAYADLDRFFATRLGGEMRFTIDRAPAYRHA